MAEKEEDEHRGPRAILELELREHEHGTEIAMMRMPQGGSSPAVPQDAWTYRFGSREAARRIFAALTAASHRWATWTRMADLLGSEFLAGVLDTEVLAASGEIARIDDCGIRDEGRGDQDETVHVSLLLGDGMPRIVGSRHGRRFVSLGWSTDR